MFWFEIENSKDISDYLNNLSNIDSSSSTILSLLDAMVMVIGNGNI